MKALWRASFITVLCTFVFPLHNFVAAAGWISGGGEILSHRENPWFLENTPVVRYCVRVDEQHVSLPKARIEEIVVEVIDYWKQQFADAYYQTNNGYGPIRFATQNFEKVNCASTIEQDSANENLDLQIQVGTISTDQKHYLSDPTDFIGAAVVSDYKIDQLRAKGFIYMSADSGPLRYKKPNLASSAWSVRNGIQFKKILAHEFGHVFGLPHRGQVEANSLMSAGFPEFMLMDVDIEFLSQWPMPNVFSPAKQINAPGDKPFCGPLERKILQFFGLLNYECIKYGIENEKFFVKAYRSVDGEVEAMREVTLLPESTARYDSWGRVGITRDQSVFANISDLMYTIGYLNGPQVKRIYRKGHVVIPHAGRKEMFFTIYPNGFDIGAVVNGVAQFSITRGF